MTEGAQPGRPIRRRGARPIGDLVSTLVEPIVARKAGMTLGLISAWPEIVGARLETGCRPEKLTWPKAFDGEADPPPATLVVACEGAFVLRLQHETQAILQRVDAFFGYHAVSRIKIVQRPVHVEKRNRKPAVKPLTARDRDTIAEVTSRIESTRLRQALERLGETVIGRNAAKPGRDLS
ncbi:DciA family protein [Aureimonas sp. ME7]|uniref:DUF721 domain-containing protein n=1 Tax=Aureimonas sp. ME7 TaxID=2744252 RepID=UPI0015F61DB1|nr:DciA family protein [Aureimonas sp. ME7]